MANYKLNVNGKRVYCVELGRVFESVADANEFLGKPRDNTNIHNSITVPGRVSAYGYTWKYLEDYPELAETLGFPVEE